MIGDLPPKLILPTKPAIIRPAEGRLQRATFPFPMFAPLVQLPITLTFQAATADSSDLTTYTFAGQALGTVGSNRRVVVGVASASGENQTISSVTVDGVGATAAHTNYASSNNVRCGIYVANATANATGTISVVFTGSVNRCVIAVWAMYDSLSATPTATYDVDLTNPATVSANCLAGGCIVGVAAHRGGATATWSGITEAYDAQTESEAFTFAADTFATAQSGLTVGPNFTSGGTLAMAAAAFR